MLVAMAGLPGSGKSTLARRLAGELAAVVLDKDLIRAALFSPAEIEYSTRQDDYCMQVMLHTAGYVLSRDRGRNVILDGRTLSRRYQRRQCRTFALRLGAVFAIIECVCSENTARDRLLADARLGRHPASNRTYKLYSQVKSQFEPITSPKLVVDTDADLSWCVEQCLVYLRRLQHGRA